MFLHGEFLFKTIAFLICSKPSCLFKNMNYFRALHLLSLRYRAFKKGTAIVSVHWLQSILYAKIHFHNTKAYDAHFACSIVPSVCPHSDYSCLGTAVTVSVINSGRK